MKQESKCRKQKPQQLRDMLMSLSKISTKETLGTSMLSNFFTDHHKVFIFVSFHYK